MDRFIESSSAFKPKLSVLEKKFASEEVLKTNRERLIKERLEQGKGLDIFEPGHVMISILSLLFHRNWRSR